MQGKRILKRYALLVAHNLEEDDGMPVSQHNEIVI